ncbi:hypothetical protein [Enterococcus gallinarum]|uniref:hypothetical protein n=1 Tax=Enterococcus gallinarum TaxID=1353 RepID=UPI001AD63B6A|nr:hypothetical protein [Enterococcus gallinarum]
MEINIKATPEEIAKLLQAIGSSKEQMIRIDSDKVSRLLSEAIRGISRVDLKKDVA